jgi:hypothetical protein
MPEDQPEKFEFTIKGEIVARESANGIVTINLEMEVNDAQPAILTERTALGYRSFFRMPLKAFPSVEKREKWIEATKKNLLRTLIPIIVDEMRLHFSDVANYHLDRQGIEKVSKKEIVESHLTAASKRVRAVVGAQGRGRRSQWTKLELSRASAAALASLPQQRKTLAGIAARLKEKHPDKAPANGEALRKLLDRFEISLESLQPDS